MENNLTKVTKITTISMLQNFKVRKQKRLNEGYPKKKKKHVGIKTKTDTKEIQRDN